MSQPETPQKAGRAQWVGLAVIALPCMVYAMDLTVLNMAIPSISQDLRPSAAELLWIVDIYGFLVAGSLITMGTLGDRIGRRRLLLIGAAAFALASILAAFASTAPTLIAARALLGVAGASLAPSTLSLIRNMFLDSHQRTVAIGVWIASFSAGGALGPLIGGFMLEHFWWGSVFLLALPVMLLLLVVGPFLLPEYRDPNAGRLDLPSAALSLAAVLAVIYGLKRLAEGGAVELSLLTIAAGLTLATIFVRRQRQLADPLIDMDLLLRPTFGTALTINVLAIFIAFGSFLFIAQYLQLVLGMTPLQAGYWTAPSGVTFAIASMLIPQLIRVVPRALLIAGGFLVSAVGFGLLSRLGTAFDPWLFMSGQILFSLGIAPVGTLTTDLIIGAAPPERAGSASAISETSFEFGGALGVAVLGSLMTAFYRGGMAQAVPAGVDPQIATAARDTLGGAVAGAANMAGPAGQALLDNARQVFTGSLAVTCLICATIAIAAAALAILRLRPAPLVQGA